MYLKRDSTTFLSMSVRASQVLLWEVYTTFLSMSARACMSSPLVTEVSTTFLSSSVGARQVLAVFPPGVGGEHLQRQRVHHLPLQVHEGQAGPPPCPVVVGDEHRLSTLEAASETMVEFNTLSSLKFCAGI